MSYVKKVLVYLLVFVGMIAFFVLDVSLATLIPKEKIKKNIRTAYEKLAIESYYPSPYFENGEGVALFDNSTEAIIFNIIYNQKGRHPFQEGVLNWWSGTDSSETIDCLHEAMKGKSPKWSYNNYWLGIILPIKFLMQWFSYGQIRYIFYMITMALAAVMFINVYKKLGKREVIAYLFTFFMFCIPNNIANLTAAGDILLAIVFSNIFVKNYQYGSKNEFRYLLFMIFGGYACFIDFLYAPVFPLGVMLVLSAMLDYRNGDSIVIQLKHLFAEMITYIISYGMTAVCKSILVLMAGGKYIGDEKLDYWISGTVKERIDAIVPPLFNLYKSEFLLVIVIYIIILAWKTNPKKAFKIKENGNYFYALYFILVGAVPPIIYFMLLAKATSHRYYVQNLFPAVFSLSYGIILMIEPKGEEENNAQCSTSGNAGFNTFVGSR